MCVCVLTVRDLHTSATHLLRYQAAERTGEKQTFELEAEDIRERRGHESREQPQEKQTRRLFTMFMKGKIVEGEKISLFVSFRITTWHGIYFGWLF